ncbi:glycosyltransferase family 2 protein [Pseudanabaena sp. FACHB-1277]|uniref:Glycosyltransferase family 2 protein n=1 Tax=Pseudanabaena cinerea FACHB-1277 TaxID=2949581 RepID=A0A926UW00_9CYAN|nr:glycosyltransferase family 2 protein [Pseudanabaena cinerea]MBD2152291.1 glycosyltransferase family 2 protein [Pseudanabaena cinerea FACHB-1277]
MLDQITPLILTYNEAANIGRTLQQLTWAKRIVVIDSFSDDETLEILSKCDRVQVLQRKFDTFASQCNFGLERITSEWVLSLDADYLVTDKLAEEILGLSFKPEVNAYRARFKYCVFGKPLRGTLLPPRTVLYRRASATYQDDGHAHRVQIIGETETLNGYIYHDDRKTLSRWLKSQDRYMQIESKKILFTPYHELGLGDRIRKAKYIAPFIILIYCLILKGGILDGWRGWYYAFQRMLAEMLLSIYLIELDNSITTTEKL